MPQRQGNQSTQRMSIRTGVLSTGQLRALADSASINVTWRTNREADLSNYALYRRANLYSSFTLLADNLTDTVYIDTAVVGGARYEYYVKAIDLDSYSSEPSEITGSTAGTFDGGFVVADAREGFCQS